MASITLRSMIRPGAAALVLSLALPVAADVRSGSGPGRVVADPPQRSSQLIGLGDCDEMMAHVSETILESLVTMRYGSGYWRVPWLDGEDEVGGAPGDYSSTNNQEAGVDELDIVKTNGTHMFVTTDEELITIASWPPDESAILSRNSLRGSPEGLLLHGSTAVAFSTFWEGENDFPRYWSGSRLDVFDVSVPEAVGLLRSIEIEGHLVSARLIDGHLYAVVMSNLDLPEAAWELVWNDDLGLPRVDWDTPEEDRSAAADLARIILAPLVDDIVAKHQPADFLPHVREALLGEAFGDPAPLLACKEVYRSPDASALAVLSVVHLDLNDPLSGLGELQASGVMSDGWTVYASAQNLYVAQSSRWWWRGWGALDLVTDIHVFTLDGSAETAVSYTASGQVPGWVQSQFGLSEHQGNLRVASTLVDWWWGLTDSGEEAGSVVTVLRNDGAGLLEQIGQISGIAPGEQIMASRMIDDRGYLVTFEQVDPLFTLDLSDPSNPVVVGELKIPGFSSYLHPIDDDHLLAVGMDGEEDGTINGLAVSVFDVGDFANPILAHSHVIEGDSETWSWSEALSDHHAFTFHRGVLSIPAYIFGQDPWFSGLVVLDVDLLAGITELGWVDHSDLPPNPNSWYRNYANMRRSVYIEDTLFSLSDRGLKVNELLDPEVLLTTVPFHD